MPSTTNISFTSNPTGFADVAGTTDNTTITFQEFEAKARTLLGLDANDTKFRTLLQNLFNAHKGNDSVLSSAEWTSLLQALNAVRLSNSDSTLSLNKQEFALGLMRYFTGPTSPPIPEMSRDAVITLVSLAFGMDSATDNANLFPDLPSSTTNLTASQIRSVFNRVNPYLSMQLGGSGLQTLFGSSDLGSTISKDAFCSVMRSQGFTLTQAQQIWHDFIGGASTDNTPLGKIMLALGVLSGQDGDSNLTVKDLNLFQINYILGNGSHGAGALDFENAYDLYFSGLCSREEAQQLFDRFACDSSLSASERMSMFLALRGSDSSVTANSIRSFLSRDFNTQGAVFAGSGRGETAPLSFDQFAGTNGTIERDEFIGRLRSRGFSEQMAGLLWQRFNTQGESMTAAEFKAMVTRIAGADGVIQASDVMAWALGDMATAGKTFSKTEFADIFNGILSRDQLNLIFDSYCSSDGRLDASELRSILTNADGNSNTELSMSELLTFSANLLYKTGEQSAIIESLLSGLKDIETEMYALAQELQGEKDLAKIAQINIRLSQLAAMQTQITGAMGKYMEMVQNLSRPLQG